MRVEVSTIISLFCLIGCVYQIYGITKSYLQFKVRHDVAYDYSTYVELPAIDIMVPVFMALNYTKLIAENVEMQKSCEQWVLMYNSKNNKNPNENCEEVIASSFHNVIAFATSVKMNLRVETIRSYSVDLRKQVLTMFVASFGSVTDRHCKLTRYYNGMAILLRIFCLNGTKPFSVNTNFVLANEGVVSYFTHSFGIQFGIRFSDPADLPDSDQSKYFMIAREPGSFPVVKMSYVKTVMRSLEYPYETNCRHYNAVESISKCMTEYTLGQSAPYLDRCAVYEWDEQPSYLRFMDTRSEKKEDSLSEGNGFMNCQQQATATECEKTSYLTEGQSSDELKGEYVLPWSEYVIFIGSIVGFWFGLSMYDLIFGISNGIKIKCLNFKCGRKE